MRHLSTPPLPPLLLLQAVGGPAFFGGLLQESDQRIRHYASVFVLRQLLLKKPQQYRCVCGGVSDWVKLGTSVPPFVHCASCC